MHTLKISVIGTGYWGKNLVRNFFDLGVLHSICDVNPACAEALAAQYQVPVLSLDALLKSDVDGVVIAAPAAYHFNLSLQALRAGKHVFVEKPLSLTTSDAIKLQQTAYQFRQKLMVGHLLQYHPAFLILKEIIAEGQLGELQYLYSNRLNLGKIRTEENILWSFAPHDISMILALAGDLPESVYATGMAHLNPEIHDVTTTHLAFKSGLQAHVFVSWLHPFKEQKLVVVGDRGMAVFDDSCQWHDKLKLYPHQIDWINGCPQPKKADFVPVHIEIAEPLKLECQHFLQCIKDDYTPRTDAEEGIRVLQVLEAAQQSLHTKRAIPLKALNSTGLANEVSSNVAAYGMSAKSLVDA